jgi:hypothetical protein
MDDPSSMVIKDDHGMEHKQGQARPGYSALDEPEELAHRGDYQPIRGMTSAVEFPVGTSPDTAFRVVQ